MKYYIIFTYPNVAMYPKTVEFAISGNWSNDEWHMIDDRHILKYEHEHTWIVWSMHEHLFEVLIQNSGAIEIKDIKQFLLLSKLVDT